MDWVNAVHLDYTAINHSNDGSNDDDDDDDDDDDQRRPTTADDDDHHAAIDSDSACYSLCIQCV